MTVSTHTDISPKCLDVRKAATAYVTAQQGYSGNNLKVSVADPWHHVTQQESLMAQAVVGSPENLAAVDVFEVFVFFGLRWRLRRLVARAGVGWDRGDWLY